MKIGILTFHNADSYGAVLQAYALQQTITKLGAEAEFVQIDVPKKQQPEANQASSAAASLFARRIQAEGQKREALFADFRNNYMNISKPYQPTDQIDGDYDSFIAGSDQIWNFRIPGADARYFLPFASADKRHSYAASFGADALPEQAKQWTSKQLSLFRSISVREASGTQIVEELTGRVAEVCLDPTLLPDRADWEALAPVNQNGDYVFLFMLKYDEQLLKTAQAQAAELNIPLKIVSAAFMPQLGIPAWNTTGVIEWLSLIRNARCVFTNSFHGMVFSMIYGRSFRIQRLGGELSSRNGRLEEMLSQLGLSEAFDALVTPDYQKIWKQLEEKKASSLEYLRRIAQNDSVDF